MNAPLPDAIRRALAEVTLDDNRAATDLRKQRRFLPARLRRRLTSCSEVKARSAGRSHKWTL